MSEKEMEGKKKGSIIITCPECRRYYRLDGSVRRKPEARVRCANCGHVFLAVNAQEKKETPEPSSVSETKEGGTRVLVATDGYELRGLIEEVLIRSGFDMRSAEEGDGAWAQITEWRPSLAIIDVGLPGVPSFELCDRARSDEDHSQMGIILVASVFQRTRYKRAPTSL